LNAILNLWTQSVFGMKLGLNLIKPVDTVCLWNETRIEFN